MSGASNAKFVGVDWAKGGWFCVAFDERGRYQCSVVPTFADLLSHYAKAALILVDSPIGLPRQVAYRGCDEEARRCLRSRKSSVFPAPDRQLAELACEAKRLPRSQFLRVRDDMNRKRPPEGQIAPPSWDFFPMVGQVDQVMTQLPAFERSRVREVHPEVCFWALNAKRPMSHGKKGSAGLRERIAVLQQVEHRVQDILNLGRNVPSSRAADDDILDALAAAITACKGYPDKLQTLPAEPPKDAYSLPMEMVFYNP